MEAVTITNMCMIYDGTRVLVQDREILHYFAALGGKEKP